eukprot:TRINITY_DN114862_c0_g1_i1.p1 TRINITY_DN114862_c0_g1~~TRINITY_DN114862_c0_g1_i1.p1  ORF type:complete len:158 (-),score=35.12 TRINITY_DN114862_c0_g1_i1:98-571(-)
MRGAFTAVVAVLVARAAAIRVDEDEEVGDEAQSENSPPSAPSSSKATTGPAVTGRDVPLGLQWFLFSQESACGDSLKLLAGDNAGVGAIQCQRLAEIDSECGFYVNSNNDYCSCVRKGAKCYPEPSSQLTAIYEAKKQLVNAAASSQAAAASDHGKP